jgi:hypothetical protein
MEKPGRPEGAPRRLNPKARSKLDLIKPLGGPQSGADGSQAQEMPLPVPHVLAPDLRSGAPSRSLPDGGGAVGIEPLLALQLSLEGFNLF